MASARPYFNARSWLGYMRDLATFQSEVQKNPTRYEPNTLIRLHALITRYGELALGAVLRDFKESYKGQLDTQSTELLDATLARYVGLWKQNLAKAFASAQNSLDGATMKRSRGKSLLRRVLDFLFNRDIEDRKHGLFVDDDGKIYSVAKLRNAAATEVEVTAYVRDLGPLLRGVTWDYQDQSGPKRLTALKIVQMLQDKTYDASRNTIHADIYGADMSQTVILRKWVVGDGIVDGAFQTANALLRGRKTLPVKVLSGGVPQAAAYESPPLRTDLSVQLSGIVRTRRIQEGPNVRREIFRIGLFQYVKMLTRTLPENFIRELTSILLKERARTAQTPRDQRLVRVTNPGAVKESARTCVLCQGRVLTADAAMFVQEWLSPPLHHPNCRHRFDPLFSDTVDDYNGRYGRVITLNDVKRWPSSQKGIRMAKRRNPHVIHV